MSQQLSRSVIDTLLDLVDNKLTAMDVIDREDSRIQSVLEAAKRELTSIRGPALPRRTLRPRNSIRPSHPAAAASAVAA
jgi:BMFP domain-containing protein YqiC